MNKGSEVGWNQYMRARNEFCSSLVGGNTWSKSWVYGQRKYLDHVGRHVGSWAHSLMSSQNPEFFRERPRENVGSVSNFLGTLTSGRTRTRSVQMRVCPRDTECVEKEYGSEYLESILTGSINTSTAVVRAPKTLISRLKDTTLEFMILLSFSANSGLESSQDIMSGTSFSLPMSLI